MYMRSTRNIIYIFNVITPTSKITEKTEIRRNRVQARLQGSRNKHDDQMNEIQVNITDVNKAGHTQQIRYINHAQTPNII